MEGILHDAERLENEYDWFGAASSYETALDLLPEHDFSNKGEVHARRAYALYRYAFQAESNDDYINRLRQAIASYEKAKGFYENTNEPLKPARTLRCNAMIASIACCLASETSEKKKQLSECWTMTKQALKAFDEVGNVLAYGKTYDQLASRVHRLCSLSNSEAWEKATREAIDCGERAITLLSNTNSQDELARAYVRVATELTTLADAFILDMDEKDRYFQKGLDYWQKANELSEEASLVELLDPSCGVLSWNIDEILTLYEKALGYARKTKDKRLTGTALDYLAYANFWKSMGTEDPEERAKIELRALQYAEDARQEFSIVSFVSSRGGVLWVAAPYAEYYYELGRRETNLEKRRVLLQQAVTNGIHAAGLAESVGYLEIQMLQNHVLSKALTALAHLETNSNEKKRLLEKALEHRKKSIVNVEQLTPSHYWNRGSMTNYEADLQAELASIEEEPEKRRRTLEEAVSNKELSLQLCVKHSSYFEKTGDLSIFAALGGYHYSHGDLLDHLYELTKKTEYPKRAVEAFEEAAKANQRRNLFSRMAECHWKAAKGYNVLGQYARASQSFSLASNDYKSAAEKIPQLKEFYEDQSLYMQAWSEIENARNCHAVQDYDSAREHYDKAAVMHKSLRQWNCLEPNYLAWAQFETAEDLSRKEHSDEAALAFEEAARLFEKTKGAIQVVLSEIKGSDEKRMVTNLMDTTEARREYCKGRIALEEAKILDRNGEHNISSQKYASAAETFERITQTAESGHERKEIECIITLSRAWQKMTQADAEASSSLYEEASRLFEQAKDLSANEKARLLALGHSRFCKALEVGTRYADTRDATDHIAATKYLQSASTYYVKAGFLEASEYAEATGKLFDAYMYMDNVKQEGDPEKKARLCMITEKMLQSSAGSYLKAKHPAKREEVLRVLERVREEREFASSLTEVIHAPSVVKTEGPLPIMWLAHEEAVGLEKFERAHVQAKVKTSKRELYVFENFELEIEIANAGKTSALLIKLEGIVPKGFEWMEKPKGSRFEGDSLIMKGKKLDALKVDEVKIVLKPKLLGTFSVNPKMCYMTEDGDERTQELEPLTLTVKELGMKGWLKG